MKYIFFSVLILIIVLSLSCNLSNTGNSGNSNDSSTEIEDNSPFYFNALSVNLDYVDVIVPLGNLNPAGGHTFPTDHIYFYFKNTAPNNIDIHSVADGTINYITKRSDTDYKINFKHNKYVESYYDHVKYLDQNIIDLAGPLQIGNNSVNINIQSNEVIGQTDPGGPALDLGAIDSRITKNFIVLSRYHFGMLHCLSPFDCYEEPLKSQLLSKNPRTIEPKGGKIDFDSDGTLAGNWFLEGTPINNSTDYNYRANHLAFVYDNINPLQIQIAAGGTLSLSPFYSSVTGNTPDPININLSSGKIKYLVPLGIPSSVILVQLIDSRKIKVEVFPDCEIDDVSDFTVNAKIYLR